MANELGNYLRQCRGDASLREFAEKCQISHTHLDSIEKGADPRTGKKVSISTDTLRLIADGIGVDFLFLACLADGWDPVALTNAVIPAGYQPKEPFHKPSISADDRTKKSLILLDFDIHQFGEADKKNPLLYSPQPVNILCCQYDIDAFLLSKICKIDGNAELWANGYHKLPEGEFVEMYPSGEMAVALADFFEIPVESLKRGVLPLFTKASVWLRVNELKKAAGYPIKNALPTEGKALKIAKRYNDLDDDGKGAVEAILDYEESRKKVTEVPYAARESDELHTTTGPDQPVDI